MLIIQFIRKETIMPNPPSSLDSTDRKILHHLQNNNRMTNVELAKLVHLSPTPCLERVRRLEKQGFITDHIAKLNPEKLGLSNFAFVQVTLDRTTENVFEEFKNAIKDVPYVLECHMVAGGFDYLLKVRTRDMNEFRTFLGDILANINGVAHTSTYVVMEEVKSTTYLPVAFV